MGGRTGCWVALCVGLIGLTDAPVHAESTCKALYEDARAYIQDLEQQSEALEQGITREFGADADRPFLVKDPDPLADLERAYSEWRNGGPPARFHAVAANSICFAVSRLTRAELDDVHLEADDITQEWQQEADKLRLMEEERTPEVASEDAPATTRDPRRGGGIAGSIEREVNDALDGDEEPMAGQDGQPGEAADADRARQLAAEDHLRDWMVEWYHLRTLQGLLDHRVQLCGDMWRWADYYERRDFDADATATLLQHVFSLFAHKAKERYPSLRLPWDGRRTFGESAMVSSMVDGLSYPIPALVFRDAPPPAPEIFEIDEALSRQSVWSLRQFDSTVPPVETDGGHVEMMCQKLTARLVRFYEVRNRQRGTMTALAEWQAGSSSLADLEEILPSVKEQADHLERTAADPRMDEEARAQHEQARDHIAKSVGELGEASRALCDATNRHAESVFVDSDTGAESEEGAPGAMRADRLLAATDKNLAAYRAQAQDPNCSADAKTALNTLIAREEGRRSNILHVLGDATQAETRRVADLKELLEKCWRDAPDFPPVDAVQAATTLAAARKLAEKAIITVPIFEDYAASADRFVEVATKWSEGAPAELDVSLSVRAFASLSSDLVLLTGDLDGRSKIRQAVKGLGVPDGKDRASFYEAAGQLADIARLIETQLTDVGAERDRLFGELARHDHELFVLTPHIIALRREGARSARGAFLELDVGPEAGVIRKLEQLSADLEEASSVLGELDANLENLGQITELVKDGERGLELIEGVRERVDLMASTTSSVKSGVDTVTDWVALKQSLEDGDPDNPAAFISATLRAVKPLAEKTGVVGIALVPFLEFYASAADAAGHAAVSVQTQLMGEYARQLLGPAPEYHLYTQAELDIARWGPADGPARDRLRKVIHVRRLMALVKAQSLNDAVDRPARTP